MKYLKMIERRNQRLRREVSRSLSARRHPDLVATVDEVIRRPLKRGFYIEVDTAIVMDRRRRAGQPVCKGSERQAYWADFFAQVDSLLSQNPRMSRTNAICRVIAAGTSNTGYPISLEQALRICHYVN